MYGTNDLEMILSPQQSGRWDEALCIAFFRPQHSCAKQVDTQWLFLSRKIMVTSSHRVLPPRISLAVLAPTKTFFFLSSLLWHWSYFISLFLHKSTVLLSVRALQWSWANRLCVIRRRDLSDCLKAVDEKFTERARGKLIRPLLGVSPTPACGHCCWLFQSPKP